MTHAEILLKLGGPTKLAADLATVLPGLRANDVATWRKRKRIPARVWVHILRHPAAIAMGVTLDDLSAADANDVKPARGKAAGAGHAKAV